jgi:hypothetical protein
VSVVSLTPADTPVMTLRVQLKGPDQGDMAIGQLQSSLWSFTLQLGHNTSCYHKRCKKKETSMQLIHLSLSCIQHYLGAQIVPVVQTRPVLLILRRRRAPRRDNKSYHRKES